MTWRVSNQYKKHEQRRMNPTPASMAVTLKITSSSSSYALTGLLSLDVRITNLYSPFGLVLHGLLNVTHDV